MLVLNFITTAVFKLVRFQMSIFSTFVTFPVSIFDLVAKKILLRSCSRFTSYILSKLHLMQQVAARIGRAVLCSLYVFLLLLFLLISCFALSGIVMVIFTQAPLLMTQTLNFDYTETSPSAFVPMPSSPSYGFSGQMRLTVSLVLPESEHNRKLGIFQVRVESISSNDEVIVGLSYPAMLRFKSQAIRVIESLMKMLPVVTGLKSEVQNVKIVVEEFGVGCEAMMGFKVSLEKRAQVEDGGGVPQIYGASLDIESELPLLQRVVWNWRLTIFVWIGFSSFLAGVMVLLLFCRSIVLPRRNNGVERQKRGDG